ncbi:MAG: RNA pseudouridine synthase [Deltaproteobacteria bacterium]|nr:RNA pseudouridine synthase [Deltaproteobacteria bacterium]
MAQPEPTVLYCDNHLLALDKPAGMPVQADASRDLDLQSWAKAWIARQFAKPGNVFCGIVHRLDRPARGVVVMARTSKAAARLARQFADRSAGKIYHAVVLGHVVGEHDLWTDWLAPTEGSTRTVAQGHPEAQRAELAWRVLDRSAGCTLLHIDLHTGRKHQIRAQCARRGHPLVGDLRYGATAPLPDRSIALLARSLTVAHPTRGEALTFSAAPPPGWPWHLEDHLAPR